MNSMWPGMAHENGQEGLGNSIPKVDNMVTQQNISMFNHKSQIITPKSGSVSLILLSRSLTIGLTHQVFLGLK